MRVVSLLTQSLKLRTLALPLSLANAEQLAAAIAMTLQCPIQQLQARNSNLHAVLPTQDAPLVRHKVYDHVSAGSSAKASRNGIEL
jgi:hypothetical protein